ncbi:MAG: FAD-dependent oxidoreductase, partial [Gammaproteobacteria bacterium]
MLLRSTAIGLYDHGAVAVVERGLPPSQSPNGERLLLLRPARTVLATGALERPLLFADNDRPGVMLVSAVLEYLRRYALRCGEQAVIACAADDAWECAFALAAAGARCTLVDARSDPPLASMAAERGLTVLAGRRVARALGSPVLSGVQLDDGRKLDADLLAVAGGWTPQIQLWCHSRARPRWDAGLAAFVPGQEVPGLEVVGAARGLPSAPPDLSQAHTGRVWVDLQHDVTAKDIALAVRENFRAVEHLKRYTTLGMATDQGRSSQLNGIALLAQASGKDIGETGITTFRPPLLPVSMATLAGSARGELQSPLRRLPAERVHREEGAVLRDYG